MGFWNDLKSVAGRFTNRTASRKPVIESMPDIDRRETISRVLTGFGKFAIDSAVNDSLKEPSGEQFKKKNKKKMKMGHHQLAGKSFGQSPETEDDVAVEMEVVEVKDKENRDDPDNGNEGLNTVAVEEELPEMCCLIGGRVARVEEELPKIKKMELTRKVFQGRDRVV